LKRLNRARASASVSARPLGSQEADDAGKKVAREPAITKWWLARIAAHQKYIEATRYSRQWPIRPPHFDRLHELLEALPYASRIG